EHQIPNLGVGGGGGGDIGYQAGSHRFVLSVRRSYRLPSLGELYLPAHADGGFTIAGNSGVDAEHAWEATVGMSSRFGPVTNELRVGTLRVGNPIAYLPVPVGAEIWRVATNGASESLGVLEDHMRVSDTVAGFNVILDGGIVWTAGDRDGFMRAAPEYRTSINARIGRDFFESTSSLYVTADYQYTAKRTGFQGDALSPYRVLNAYFELRLIDAYLYLGLMNALDESYQTAGGYLMTPRTFMYGIAWNLFD
ncbi:MAG: TonB-dependent receptor, partial [Candidatus Krumholzibacteriota bacterium]|nr:TonB-dependent receptor [Candidatus Krumholzibacteriota bacterium]